MSKSLGNIVTVKEILKAYPKELIRFFILSNHYRSELEFHDQKLDEVSRGWQRLNDCVNVLAKMVDKAKIEPETAVWRCSRFGRGDPAGRSQIYRCHG